MASSYPVIRGDSLYTLVDMDISTDPPSWFNSGRNEANKVGGELATVTTKDEYTFIVDSFKNETDRAIIGLHDSSDYLEYRWTSGAEVDLSQLDSELKLDFTSTGDHGEDYVGMYFEEPDVGSLNDYGYASGGMNNLPNLGIAETPFIRREDSAYVIVEGPTWEDAEANANKLGGHLVSINDAEENQWLVDNFKDDESKYFDGGKDIFWIGLNRDNFDEWQVG